MFRPVKHWLYRPYYRLYPVSGPVEKPVFIIGCGRSGTTILGRILAHHPQVTFLQEPRHIWRYEPLTNIWARGGRARGARLRLTAAEADSGTAAAIQRAFAVEAQRHGRHRVVSKLPINSFRVGFIDALFPDALFVHLIRNGLEVARSIARLVEAGRWYGGDKWDYLRDYAHQRGEASLVGLCQDNFLRGLLEWYLSVSTARADLHHLPARRWLEVRYEDLLARPFEVCNTLEAFTGLPHSPEMGTFATANLARRSQPADMTALPPQARAIAGDLLAELGYLPDA